MSGARHPGSVDAALEALRAGGLVVLVGAEGRGEEGDLLLAGELATPEAVAFMATHARGLISVCLPEERCDALGLRPIAGEIGNGRGGEVAVSVEARDGITTGISAHDRARTIQVAANPTSTARDLVRPGHVLPLRASAGGVLERPGRQEAAVDLPRLAGLAPTGAVCEILNDDGTTARLPDLVGFAGRHGLPIVRVSDVVAYRREREPLVVREVAVRLPTGAGTYQAVAYRDTVTSAEHVALVKGDPAADERVPVSVHRECLAGNVFRSRRCGCARRLEDALEAIERHGIGVVVYLTGEGGAVLGPQGCSAPSRSDGEFHDANVVTQILADLGVRSIRGLPHASAARPRARNGVAMPARARVPAPAPVENG